MINEREKQTIPAVGSPWSLLAIEEKKKELEEKKSMNYKERISANPKVMLGKPVIKGTRITVELILRKIAGGYSFDEIIEMYPHIAKEDILACVGYAASVIESEDTLQSA